MNKLFAATLFAAAMTAGTAMAVPVTLLDTDFNSLPSGISGYTTTTQATGLGSVGMTNKVIHNRTTGNPASATNFAIAGVGTGSSVVVTFNLGLIDSWDSNNGSPSPDWFNVFANGSSVYQLTTNNASGSAFTPPAGTTLLSSGTNKFGSSYKDSFYSVSLNFLSTAQDLTLSFFASGAGWQGGGDESWMLDNLKVTAEAPAVPLPAGLPLLVGALAVFGVARRKRA